MAFRRAAVTFFEGTSRLAAAAAIIIIGSAAKAWAQSEDCEATCPVPCMFGLCSATIDVEPNACSEARSQSLFSVALSQNDCIGYEAFITACPDTPEARLAEASLRRLSCGGEVEPTPAASPNCDGFLGAAARAPAPGLPQPSGLPGGTERTTTERILRDLPHDAVIAWRRRDHRLSHRRSGPGRRRGSNSTRSACALRDRRDGSLRRTVACVHGRRLLRLADCGSLWRTERCAYSGRQLSRYRRRRRARFSAVAEPPSGERRRRAAVPSADRCGVGVRGPCGHSGTLLDGTRHLAGRSAVRGPRPSHRGTPAPSCASRVPSGEPLWLTQRARQRLGVGRRMLARRPGHA